MSKVVIMIGPIFALVLIIVLLYGFSIDNIMITLVSGIMAIIFLVVSGLFMLLEVWKKIRELSKT